MKINAMILLFVMTMTIPCASSAAPKDQIKIKASANVDTSVVQKMEELRSKAGERFDPNSYFTILTHIAMKRGYVLDYVYWQDGAGSYPCLYVRRASEPPRKLGSLKGLSGEEMRQRRASLEGICDAKNIVNLLPFMTADGSPDSYFQLSVFLKVARQFRLVWHANYNDIRIVTSAADIDEIARDVNSYGQRKGPDPNMALWARAKAWLTEPEVVLSPDTAEVTYSTFTKWGGFSRMKDTFDLKSPHSIVKSEVLDKIEYNCGIRF
ncbi:MAG: hypothetical protein WC956_06710 [bacterium]